MSEYTVVVAIGSTATSAAPLRWAVEEAAARRGRVVAVRGWRPAQPGVSGTRPPLQTYDSREDHGDAEARLVADVESLVGADAAVECRLVVGGRRKALLAAAADADLLVVGGPRRARIGEGLGFAHRLLYSTQCPIVVMPPTTGDRVQRATEPGG